MKSVNIAKFKAELGKYLGFIRRGVLRILFSEKNALKLPKNIQFYAASEILKIECFRTLDRIKHSLSISDDEISEKHATLYKYCIHFILLSYPIPLSKEPVNHFRFP